MDRAWAKNAVKDKPNTDMSLYEIGYAADTGDRTVPGAGWFNAVTSEILGVLTKAGITPDAKSDTQLADAIVKLIGGAGDTSGGGSGGGSGGTASGAALTAGGWDHNQSVQNSRWSPWVENRQRRLRF